MGSDPPMLADRRATIHLMPRGSSKTLSKTSIDMPSRGFAHDDVFDKDFDRRSEAQFSSHAARRESGKPGRITRRASEGTGKET